MSIENLFEGQELSAEAKNKITEQYTKSVQSAVDKAIAEQVIAATEKESAIREEYEQKINQMSEEYEQKVELYIENEIVPKVDKFLNYVADKWLEENKLAVESSLKVEMAESFLSGLVNLFQENYVDVPDSKVDVVEALTLKVEELQSKNDQLMAENIEYGDHILLAAKHEVINHVCEGVVLSEAEKIKEIAEGIEYSDIDEFERRVIAIKESVVKSEVNSGATIQENVSKSKDEYVNFLAENLVSF
jgi:hypothetical protein